MRNRKLPQEWVKFVTGFSEVEGQPNLLVCWVAGSGARVVDQLEDRDVRTDVHNSILPTSPTTFFL